MWADGSTGTGSVAAILRNLRNEAKNMEVVLGCVGWDGFGAWLGMICLEVVIGDLSLYLRLAGRFGVQWDGWMLSDSK